MRSLIFLFLLILLLALGGCAASPQPVQPVLDEEWPSGFGTIPPSWYDYDPALKHWYDPWYNNPYTPK